METIQKNTCQEIGYLQKPHGIKGGISLVFEPQYELSLENEPTLFLEMDGLLVPYFFADDGIRIRSSELAIIHLGWVKDEIDARKICGSSVYLKDQDFIVPEEELTIHHLVGFELHDENIGRVGRIEKVEDFGGNLLFMLSFQGKEVLIPFNDDLLISLDEEKKTISMQCPDGIFDLE